MIIAAHAGTGKSIFATLCPERVIDLVAMPYKYHLEQCDNPEAEKNKANFDNIMRDDWPNNYVAAIKEEMVRNPEKIIVIPSDLKVRKLLEEGGIPYVLCYPHRDAKETYRKRYIERGNTDDFLRIFIDGWEHFLDSLEGDTYGKHIVMQADEYLSDVIDI